jgi:hypothetical protein
MRHDRTEVTAGREHWWGDLGATSYFAAKEYRTGVGGFGKTTSIHDALDATTTVSGTSRDILGTIYVANLSSTLAIDAA